MGAKVIDKRRQVIEENIVLYDRWLLFSVAGIIIIGLLMVASSSIVISERLYNHSFHYLVRQSCYLTVGAVIAIIAFKFDSQFWEKISIPALLVSIVLLIAVLIPGVGHTVNGSARWLHFGVIGMQVSELAKFATILYMARYLTQHHEEVRTQVSGFLKPMLVLGVIAVLLLKEPDFGAAVVITITVMTMVFLAGVKLRHFILCMLLAGGAIIVLAVSSPYRLARLTAFINPWDNQFDSGYQLTQSLIAFGRGGITGVGLGASIQKLFYLPEAHTDFLFAVLAEELGLIGVTVVLALYTIFITRGLAIARKAQLQGQLFCAYLAYGLVLWLGIQTVINIGVNAGLLPTKGLTLPLMSSGGSSMLVDCVVIAILCRIDHESRWRSMGLGQIKKRGRKA